MSALEENIMDQMERDLDHKTEQIEVLRKENTELIAENDRLQRVYDSLYVEVARLRQLFSESP